MSSFAYSPRVPRAGFATAAHRRPRKPRLAPYGPRQPNLVGVGAQRQPAPYGPRQPTLVGVGASGPSAPAAAATPDYAAQARAQVSAQLDPMLRYIAQKYGAQMSAFQNYGQQATSAYASALGRAAGDTQAMFQQAKSPISGAASGINRQMVQIGQANAAREADAAAAAHQTGAQSPDVNLAQEGKGAGQAAGAIGEAMIQALNDSQAAAMRYAEQLPAFATAQGAQQVNQGLQQLAATMADQMAQTTAQAPQLYYTIYQNLLDRAQNDRQFAEQVRQFNVEQNRLKAGIQSPSAPTVGGRQSYWQSVADQRTQDTGYQWIGTSTGIRPVDADPKKPGIQPQLTLKGQAATAGGVPPTRSVPGRGLVQWDGKKWVPVPGTAPPAKPVKPPKPGAPHTKTVNGVTYQWNGKTWVRAKGLPKDTTTGTDGKPKVTGSAPRRVAPGVWVTRSGKRLSPAAAKIWEKKWRNHETDGHGKVYPPPKAGSGPDYNN